MKEASVRVHGFGGRADDWSSCERTSLRRAEDRIRDEHHDAYARTLGPVVAADPDVSAAAPHFVGVHIVKTPPAPIMDGFNLSGLRAGDTVVVDLHTARYLFIAGYGIPSDDTLAHTGH